VSEVTLLLIDALRRRADARPLDDAALSGLAESIEQLGLINPIRVRRSDGGKYEVIAGSHRFAACDLAGLREIPCIIVTDDDLHAELAMIDENLCRAELSPADRAKQTARRKAIYLELHPETAHGANLQGAGVANLASPETPAFSTATAKLTGLSERAVQRDAERGEKVIDEALSLIRGTRLDTGVYLDRLKKLPPNEQMTAAKRDLAWEKKRADGPRPNGGANATAKPASPPPDPTKAASTFVALADQIAEIPIDALVQSGQMRATVGQRASGLADRLAEIMESLHA